MNLSRRWQRLAVCSAFLAASFSPVGRAQDTCSTAPASELSLALEQAFAGNNQFVQTKAAASFVDVASACTGNKAVVAALLDRAEQASDQATAMQTVAVILNLSRAPWDSGDEAKQQKWKDRLSKAYDGASDEKDATLFNGALMNSAGLYREALAKITTARPGTAEHVAVRAALQNTIKYERSLNYDDALFLLGELAMRDLIAARKGVGGVPDASTSLTEARKLFGDLIEQPRHKPPKYTLYGHWNLSLLSLLGGNANDARTSLSAMKSAYEASLKPRGAGLWNHTLYYFRALHYYEFPQISNHITAGELHDRWIESPVVWAPGASFTDANGARRLADELVKTFKDTRTYFVSMGSFPTYESAENRRIDLEKTSGVGRLVVHPPWPERKVFTVGTPLMTLAEARKFIQDQSSKLPKSASITRFF